MAKLLCGLLTLALCTTAAGCGGGADTSVRLDVRFEDGWELTGLDVEAGEMHRTVPVAEELLVQLPDEWAGGELDVVVAGMRDGQRFAAGRTTVVPELGREVHGVVTLQRLPCGSWCTEGASRCEGDGVVVCERQDDGCLQWGEATRCPPETPSCALGRCLEHCVDECAEGETQCVGPGQVRQCGQSDSDPCLDWQPAVACAEGESCAGGKCAGGCRDQCEAGAVQCLGGGVARCGDLDLDGCTEWGPAEPCADGESCSEGRCQSIEDCSDECEGSACHGLTFTRCGQYDLDPCLEPSPGTSCEPADPCLEGQCSAEEGCGTKAKACTAPPEPECVDDSTLRVFDTTGSCGTDGSCEYESREVDCPSCPACDACAGVTCDSPPAPSACYEPAGACSEGACSYSFRDGADCDDGDACTEGDTCTDGGCAGTTIACEDPPPDECVDDTTLRTYGSAGSCSGGACSYPSSEMSCLGGCSDGACNGCGADERACGGACATCPTEGVTYTTCAGGRCVASGCDAGYAACGDACCDWALETVGEAGGDDQQISLAVGPDGWPHIAYRMDSPAGLAYATRDASGWSFLHPDANGGLHMAIAVDAAGNVRIVYDDNSWSGGDLHYLADPVAGSPETVGPSVDWGVSLVLDGSAAPHVAYVGPDDELRHAWLDGGAWSNELIDGTVQMAEPSIDVDASGRPYIAYRNLSGSDLAFAQQAADGSWSRQTVDGVASTGRHPSLAIDSSGHAHISYITLRSSVYQLRYAEWTGSSWNRQTLAESETLCDTSIALNADDEPRIAYSDCGDPDQIGYAWSNGGSWSFQTIDGAVSAAGSVSMALDDAGRAHVAYIDFVSGTLTELRYAHQR